MYVRSILLVVMVNIQQYLLSFKSVDDLIHRLQMNIACTVKQKDDLSWSPTTKKLSSTMEQPQLYRHFRGLIFERSTRKIVNYPLSGSCPEAEFHSAIQSSRPWWKKALMAPSLICTTITIAGVYQKNYTRSVSME